MYQINNNDFKILNKYKIFLDKLDDLLENVPRKDLFFKDLIKAKAYETLEIILACSYEKDNYVLYNNKIKTNLAMMDFLFDRLLNKRYISEKSAYNIATLLVEINKMVSGWIKSMSNNASKS